MDTQCGGLGFHRREKGETWGMKSPPEVSYGRYQQVWCVDLLTRSFQGCHPSSQLACPELLSPPEAYRSLTLQVCSSVSVVAFLEDGMESVRRNLALSPRVAAGHGVDPSNRKKARTPLFW